MKQNEKKPSLNSGQNNIQKKSSSIGEISNVIDSSSGRLYLVCLTTSSGKSIVDWLSLLIRSQCECNSTFEVLAFPRTKERVFSIFVVVVVSETKTPSPIFREVNAATAEHMKGCAILFWAALAPEIFCSLALTAKPACEHLKPNRCKNNNCKSIMCKRERGDLLEHLL